MMSNLLSYIPEGTKTVAIFGHMHPDGDCCGSMSAVARCIHEAYPELEITIYANEYEESLGFLFRGLNVIPYNEERTVDFGISLDVSDDVKRIAVGLSVWKNAKHKLQIDHHVTNSMFADINIVSPQAISTCEILTGMMDFETMSVETASALYTGIIHDSGLFRFEAVTPETMRKAAMLLEKKIPFTEIIRDTITDAPLNEKKLIAECVIRSVLIPEEQFLYCICPLCMQRKYGLEPS